MASVEIITGVGSTDHVTSQDQQAVNQGMVGTGRYVFAVGSELAAVKTSNNLVTISDGTFCVGGILGRIAKGSTDAITIENGESASVNRKDLICLHYTKESDIESLAWEVVKGTSAASASDPAYTTGDVLSGATEIYFPMYRVNLTGLDITSIDELFDVVPALCDILTGASTQIGTTVVNPSGAASVEILTLAKVNALFGTSLTADSAQLRVFVSAENAHYEANNAIVCGTSFRKTSGKWYAHFASKQTGSMRINYAVTLGGE